MYCITIIRLNIVVSRTGTKEIVMNLNVTKISWKIIECECANQIFCKLDTDFLLMNQKVVKHNVYRNVFTVFMNVSVVSERPHYFYFIFLLIKYDETIKVRN